MTILRPELLRGRSVVVVGDDAGTLSAGLSALGASVAAGPDDARLASALVYDARPAFGEGGQDGLRRSLEDAWQTIGEIAGASLIPAQEPTKIVLIGPHPDAGALAEAARAALENLARTLSIEWARYSITTVMVAPGPPTDEKQLSELICFLVCGAGDYLSGCRLELGAVGQ